MTICLDDSPRSCFTALIAGSTALLAQPAAELPNDVHWVRATRRNTRPSSARTYQRRRPTPRGARPKAREAGTWAVALDADENGDLEQPVSEGARRKERELLERNLGRMGAAGARPPPCPGPARFPRAVCARSAAVSPSSPTAASPSASATRKNFRAQELLFDVILCRGEDGDKNPRWDKVRKGTAKREIAAPSRSSCGLGDNIHDFPGMDQERALRTRRLRTSSATSTSPCRIRCTVPGSSRIPRTDAALPQGGTASLSRRV